ncbi:hypothetical protein PCASD_06039 [Puccinia coronata f. sp. avenae]|uniref:Uncharacterized protein n=1 Tax=Puccinia coronata f. sp. avenae TaxID=200324 RepID=A0A2N5UZB5_9BASI|nr:hypothetical protein PCASD_06039 [Puccinia coronata f. sp. avenae]
MAEDSSDEDKDNNSESSGSNDSAPGKSRNVSQPSGVADANKSCLNNPTPARVPPASGQGFGGHQSRSQMLTPLSQSTSSRRTSTSQGGVQAHLTNLLDPEAQKARKNESSMSQFYAMRLQESTSTINQLQDEANWLREGVNIQVLHLQDKLQQTRKELSAKVTENQDLKHRIDLLQLRIELTQAGPTTGGFMRGVQPFTQ